MCITSCMFKCTCVLIERGKDRGWMLIKCWCRVTSSCNCSALQRACFNNEKRVHKKSKTFYSVRMPLKYTFPNKYEYLYFILYFKCQLLFLYFTTITKALVTVMMFAHKTYMLIIQFINRIIVWVILHVKSIFNWLYLHIWT